MKKNKQPPAYYICATVDVFNIQVMLIVGDFDECCKLIEENRSLEYKGPKMSDGLRREKEETDKSCKTRNGYLAFTAHVGPGIIIYAPGPITLSTLVHEISHAVDYIFHITGTDDDELRAYLCGYLFTELAAKDKDIITPLSGNSAGGEKKGAINDQGHQRTGATDCRVLHLRAPLQPLRDADHPDQRRPHGQQQVADERRAGGRSEVPLRRGVQRGAKRVLPRCLQTRRKPLHNRVAQPWWRASRPPPHIPQRP